VKLAGVYTPEREMLMVVTQMGKTLRDMWGRGYRFEIVEPERMRKDRQTGNGELKEEEVRDVGTEEADDLGTCPMPRFRRIEWPDSNYGHHEEGCRGTGDAGIDMQREETAGRCYSGVRWGRLGLGA
jgi:hypothetical protein